MLKIPVIIDKISTLKDGSVKVSLETQEMPTDKMAALFDLRNQEAWAVLSPSNNIKMSDIPHEQPDALIANKSPSQRLRAVLFVHWQQRGSDGDFETYYRTNMERIIDTVKGQLDG